MEAKDMEDEGRKKEKKRIIPSPFSTVRERYSQTSLWPEK